MKTTMIEKDKNHYIKKFKTLLGNGKIDRNAELAMLSAYGVESCKDMTIYELIELCQKVELMVDPELAKMDKLRKNVLGSIKGWLELTGRKGMSLDYIKSIACRSAKVENFNRIKEKGLRKIIGEFNRDQEFEKGISKTKIELLNEAKIISTLN